jgi:hypothetical protein
MNTMHTRTHSFHSRKTLKLIKCYDTFCFLLCKRRHVSTFASAAPLMAISFGGVPTVKLSCVLQWPGGRENCYEICDEISWFQLYAIPKGSPCTIALKQFYNNFIKNNKNALISLQIFKLLLYFRESRRPCISLSQSTSNTKFINMCL